MVTSWAEQWHETAKFLVLYSENGKSQDPRPVAQNATRAGHPRELRRAKARPAPDLGGDRRTTERDTLKVATFNINDINKRLENLLAWLAKAEPC